MTVTSYFKSGVLFAGYARRALKITKRHYDTKLGRKNASAHQRQKKKARQPFRARAPFLLLDFAQRLMRPRSELSS